MPDLWHFTCAHTAAHLGPRGILRPVWQPLLGLDLTWATDLAEADAEALGLTAVLTTCDRTAARYRILDPDAWQPFASWWPGRLDPRVVSMLTYPPKRPARWWVIEAPAAVVLDP